MSGNLWGRSVARDAWKEIKRSVTGMCLVNNTVFDNSLTGGDLRTRPRRYGKRWQPLEAITHALAAG